MESDNLEKLSESSLGDLKQVAMLAGRGTNFPYDLGFPSIKSQMRQTIPTLGT
jgi:hypothetical protein